MADRRAKDGEMKKPAFGPVGSSWIRMGQLSAGGRANFAKPKNAASDKTLKFSPTSARATRAASPPPSNLRANGSERSRRVEEYYIADLRSCMRTSSRNLPPTVLENFMKDKHDTHTPDLFEKSNRPQRTSPSSTGGLRTYRV